MQFLDTLTRHSAVFLAQTDLHALAESSAVHTADGYSANIIREVKRGDQHLRITIKDLGLRYMFYYRIKSGSYVLGGFIPVKAHPSILRRTVYGGEVKLFFGSIQAEHQVKHHFLHLIGAAIGLVDLVDHNYRLQSHLYCFLKHETCLWHRTFKSIDKKQTTVSHIKHTLHLSTEIGVSGSVYDVYLISLVIYRYVL